MARLPKTAPKSKSTRFRLSELTEKQGRLLAWVYWTGQGKSVVWSAKAYLERSPTKSEAATLSKRVKSLVDYDVLSRSGRDVTLTPVGRKLLYEWAANKHDLPIFEGITLLLEINELMDEFDAVFNILVAGIRHLEDEDEANALSRAVIPLRDAIGRKIIEFGKRLRKFREDES